MRQELLKRGLLALAISVPVIVGCDRGIKEEEGFVEIGEVQLYYKSLGRGEPVLVVHGGPGLNHTYFLPQMRELARSHRLIFYDQRACGRSTGNFAEDEISIARFVDDIEALRQSFGIDKLNLMGHSWGGLLVMHYAITYPQHLRSLLLVNSVGASSASQQEGDRARRSRFTSADSLEQQEILRSAAFVRGDPQAIARLLRLNLRLSFYDRAMIDSLRLEIPASFIEHSGLLQFLRKDLSNFSIYDRLRSVPCPTLIVHGDHDVIPESIPRQLQSVIGRSRLVVLENCGHFPWIEAPEPFFREIREFLREAAK